MNYDKVFASTLLMTSFLALAGCSKSNAPPNDFVETVFTRSLNSGPSKVNSVSNIKCKPSPDAEGRYVCFADVATANADNGKSGTMRYGVAVQKRNEAWFMAGMVHQAGSLEQQ